MDRESLVNLIADLEDKISLAPNEEIKNFLNKALHKRKQELGIVDTDVFALNFNNWAVRGV